MISDCNIKELDVILNNVYSFASATVTAADQQSGEGLLEGCFRINILP